MKSKGSRQTIEATLNLLNAIHEDENHTQRRLATKMGVALGLTNALVKRCVKKGILKIGEAPARRYAYYLTPRGFREKSRLTAEYLSLSLDFFRKARSQFAEAVNYCENRGWKRLVFFGAGELSEIAFLATQNSSVELIALIDPKREGEQFCGLVVRGGLDAVSGKEVDAFLVTETADPQQAYEFLCSKVSSERIVTPPVLSVLRIQDEECQQ